MFGFYFFAFQGSNPVAAPDSGPLLPQLVGQGPFGAGAAPSQADLGRSDQSTGGTVEEQRRSHAGRPGETGS